MNYDKRTTQKEARLHCSHYWISKEAVNMRANYRSPSCTVDTLRSPQNRATNVVRLALHLIKFGFQLLLPICPFPVRKCACREWNSDGKEHP